MSENEHKKMSCCCTSCVFYGLGVILGLYLLKKVVGFVYAHFIYKNPTNYKGKNVLITGATAGRLSFFTMVKINMIRY